MVRERTPVITLVIVYQILSDSEYADGMHSQKLVHQCWPNIYKLQADGLCTSCAAIYMLELEQDLSTCQLKAVKMTPVDWCVLLLYHVLHVMTAKGNRRKTTARPVKSYMRQTHSAPFSQEDTCIV